MPTDPHGADVHEWPLADRVVGDIIREWLDRKTNLARASADTSAKQRGIDELRHVWLDGYRYDVVPQILDALKRAGSLVAPEAPDVH